MIKEYFAKHVQALQTGCLLHICCKVKAMCYKIGKFKSYFRLKVVYVQVDTTDMQYFYGFQK